MACYTFDLHLRGNNTSFKTKRRSQERTPLYVSTVWHVLEGEMQKCKEKANKEALSAPVHLIQPLFYVLTSPRKLYQKYGVYLSSKCLFSVLSFLKLCELCIIDSKTLQNTERQNISKANKKHATLAWLLFPLECSDPKQHQKMRMKQCFLNANKVWYESQEPSLAHLPKPTIKIRHSKETMERYPFVQKRLAVL